jgi:hypothetical protein
LHPSNLSFPSHPTALNSVVSVASRLFSHVYFSTSRINFNLPVPVLLLRATKPHHGLLHRSKATRSFPKALPLTAFLAIHQFSTFNEQQEGILTCAGRKFRNNWLGDRIIQLNNVGTLPAPPVRRNWDQDGCGTAGGVATLCATHHPHSFTLSFYLRDHLSSLRHIH